MSYPPEYYANRVIQLEGELFQMRKDRAELVRIVNQWQEVCAGALESGRNYQALADRATTVAEQAIAALTRSQQEVADWQRKEVQKASCCDFNEQRAKTAEQLLAAADRKVCETCRHPVKAFTDDSLREFVYECQLMWPARIPCKKLGGCRRWEEKHGGS